MPIYEYECPVHGKFEELRSMDTRLQARCPVCGSQALLKVSKSTFKLYNPFTKDGEGFSSVFYSKEEAKARIKANAGKYESL